MLVLQHIYKQYPTVQALRDINLKVHTGEYVSIIGASGSGKTTLMQIIGCLDMPTSGKYSFQGVDIHQLSANAVAQLRGKEIGFIFQSFRLSPDLTALENVALPLLFRGVGRTERLYRAKQALCTVGLSHRLYHFPSELSGGQQQRTAIARAICCKPALLLADEATGNLDPHATQEILEILDMLHQKGHTILLITHDAAVAARAQTHLQMDDGRLSAVNA